MKVTFYSEKDNTLYINSNAITPKNLTVKQLKSYLNKPYEERISESPFKHEIESAMKKYPNCEISEFMNV